MDRHDHKKNAREFLDKFETQRAKYKPLEFDTVKKIPDDYEKELKRLRNSSDPKYREDNGFVPWMDGYDVMGVIPMRIQGLVYVGNSPAPEALLTANEIIRNMMRVV